ncbi:hypothetical protein GCM10009700_21120 [Brevibacterium sanguinis]
MVVDEFDIVRSSLSPDEADAPLRVDPDAVLTRTIAGELLQTIPWRDPQILDIVRRVDQFELSKSRSLDHPVYAFDVLLMPDALGVLAAERSDHGTNI